VDTDRDVDVDVDVEWTCGRDLCNVEATVVPHGIICRSHVCSRPVFVSSPLLSSPLLSSPLRLLSDEQVNEIRPSDHVSESRMFCAEEGKGKHDENG